MLAAGLGDWPRAGPNRRGSVTGCRQVGSGRGGGGRGPDARTCPQGPAAPGRVRSAPGPEDLTDHRERKHQTKPPDCPTFLCKDTVGGAQSWATEQNSARPPPPAHPAPPELCATRIPRAELVPTPGSERRSRQSERLLPRRLPEYEALLLSSKQSVAAASTLGCLPAIKH